MYEVSGWRPRTVYDVSLTESDATTQPCNHTIISLKLYGTKVGKNLSNVQQASKTGLTTV